MTSLKKLLGAAAIVGALAVATSGAAGAQCYGGGSYGYGGYGGHHGGFSISIGGHYGHHGHYGHGGGYYGNRHYARPYYGHGGGYWAAPRHSYRRHHRHHW